jgi:hypothetical protein
MRLGEAAGRLAGIALIVYVVLLRLPFVALGFGSDWDAWRLARSGRDLWAGAGYVTSRPPGYPVSEALFGSVERFGPIMTNLVSVLASVLIALALVRLLEVAGRTRAVITAACALSLPVAIVAGSSTMDYAPSLAAFLWALVFAEQRKPLLSATLFALSVGARPATLFFAPVWFVLVSARSGAKQSVWAAFLACTAIALLMLPPALFLGLSHMGAAVGAYPSRYEIARRVWDETFGPIGLAALVCGACALLLPRTVLHHDDLDDATKRIRACFLWIGIIGCAVYLWIPYESGYLLPPAIAGVAWVGMQVPSKLLPWLAAAFLLSAHFDPIGGSSALARDEDYRRRVAHAAEALRWTTSDLVRPAVVVTGFLMPPWQYVMSEDDGLRSVRNVSAADVSRLRAEGKRVYFVPTIASWHRRMHHVDLAEIGAVPLPTSDEILLDGLDFQK